MASRTTVSVKYPNDNYPVWVGAGLLSQAARLFGEVLPNAGRVMIVSDTNVAPLYLKTLSEALEDSGLTVTSTQIEPGETNKTMATVDKLYEHALGFSLKRNNAIVALGGGIVGDITGFFASSYLRGVPFVQVPTTLLAQVDASIGGKVGVNWRYYKNLVGAFYHPKAIIVDTDTLQTLPEKAYNCGMAEVIKYALIEKSIAGAVNESNLFSFLQQPPESLKDYMESVILRSCELKGAVVKADPGERMGIREILNLGHTFAHAYETLSKGAIPHGEAVAIGIAKAYSLSVKMDFLPVEVQIQVHNLLQLHNLPLESPEPFSADDIINVMRHDKKSTVAGSLRLVLPYESIGKVQIYNAIPAEAVASVL